MENLKVAELKQLLTLMNESTSGSKDVLINRIKTKVCSDKTPIKFTYIDIPFGDKDEAKALGAKWSPNQKKWKIIDDPENLKKFKKWTTKETLNLVVSFEDKDRVKALGAKWNPTTKSWYVLATDENKAKFAPWILNSKKPLVLVVDFINEAFTADFRDLKPTWDEYAGVWTVPDTEDNRIKFAKWLIPGEDIDIDFVRMTRQYLTALIKDIRTKKKIVLDIFEKSGADIALTHLTNKLDGYDEWYLSHLPIDQRDRGKALIKKLRPIIVETWHDSCDQNFINTNKYQVYNFSSTYKESNLLKNFASYIYDIYRIEIGIIQKNIQIKKEYDAASKRFFLEIDYNIAFQAVYNKEYSMYEVPDTPENRLKYIKYIKDDEPLTIEFIVATKNFVKEIVDAIKKIKPGEYENGTEIFNTIMNNIKKTVTNYKNVSNNKAERYINEFKFGMIDGMKLAMDVDKYSDKYEDTYTYDIKRKPKDINKLIRLIDFKTFIASTIYHKFK